MSHGMRALVAPIVATLLVLAAPLHADATEDAAQVHLDRGVAAFRAGDYVLAHRELDAAHGLVPDKPNPYRWLALTEVQLGDCARALVNIDGFLSRVPPSDPRRAEVERLRELCQRTGVLAVDSTPPKASLRIDGAAVGVTPYRSLSMRAGAHTVIAELPGYRTMTRTIDLQAGGELALHLPLAKVGRPVTRRWWFWPAVVGAALTITGIVAVIAIDSDPTVLPPIECDPTGCHPGEP
jgi:hypothetical protein